MLTQQEAPRAGGPAKPVRPPSDPRIARRRFIDRLAAWIVVLGGMAIIGSIIAILFVILLETLPLFSPPQSSPAPALSVAPDGAPFSLGTDEYQETVWVASPGGVTFFQRRDGKKIPVESAGNTENAGITAASTPLQGAMIFGLKDGRALRCQTSFGVSYDNDKRKITPSLKYQPPMTLDKAGRPVKFIVQGMAEKGPIVVGSSGGKDVSILTMKKKKGLMADSGKMEEVLLPLTLNFEGDISAMAIDSRGDDLFVGTTKGELVRVELRDPANPKSALPLLVSSKAGAAVSVLGLLNGERTLVVGDSSGGVSSWQMLRSEAGDYFLSRINTFDGHSAAVAAFSPSLRDKGFVSADVSGGVHLNYGTTGSVLLDLKAPSGDLRGVALTPKADGVLAIDGTGRVASWVLKNPHPEATLTALFGRVWYEGYPGPESVWQSTGGTDDFEAKFSLLPLIFGTLKGTFYALLIAVPLALLSALYVSQFMHPALKANVKPVIEVMAALPSVVLGFIAALWLAPKVESLMPGFFVMPFVMAGLILVSVAIWRSFPLSLRQRLPHGSEIMFLVPIVLVGAALSFWLGGALEAGMLGGDYRAWMLRVMGLTYDQRNSVVVGFAMGFAVVPIIFTIAEDSLSNVPPYLSAGSLALGATRWQTAIKVVLPSGSPGIFSAIMIGFGRAVGETMIVLMATGNTPIMEMTPFKGFRAMSANIAVELPDAAVGGTLYRILFLAAFLLFLMTFVVNTLAELIRIRLRKKFQYL